VVKASVQLFVVIIALVAIRR